MLARNKTCRAECFNEGPLSRLGVGPNKGCKEKYCLEMGINRRKSKRDDSGRVHRQQLLRLRFNLYLDEENTCPHISGCTWNVFLLLWVELISCLCFFEEIHYNHRLFFLFYHWVNYLPWKWVSDIFFFYEAVLLSQNNLFKLSYFRIKIGWQRQQ